MEAVGPALAAIGFLVLMAAFLIAPLAMIVGLLVAARTRLQGRRTPLDGLFTGMARANLVRNQLGAGIPGTEVETPWHRHRRGRRRQRT